MPATTETETGAPPPMRGLPRRALVDQLGSCDHCGRTAWLPETTAAGRPRLRCPCGHACAMPFWFERAWLGVRRAWLGALARLGPCPGCGAAGRWHPSLGDRTLICPGCGHAAAMPAFVAGVLRGAKP